MSPEPTVPQLIRAVNRFLYHGWMPTAPGQEIGIPRGTLRGLAHLARFLERNSAGMGLAQYRVLSTIAAGDVRASQLASRLTVGKPAVSAILETLAARGFLERAVEPDDRRATCLTVTEAGRRALDTAEHTMAEALAEILAMTAQPALAADQLAALAEALASRRGAAPAGSSDPAPPDPS